MITTTFRDELYLGAVTVYMESAGEPWEGQLAVAHVICTRARASGRSIFDTIFKPYQFSCWNTESITRMRIDSMDQSVFARCYAAFCAAYFELLPDPTNGADHYLNVTTVLDQVGKLPKWYDESKVTARIAKHTFLLLA